MTRTRLLAAIAAILMLTPAAAHAQTADPGYEVEFGCFIAFVNLTGDTVVSASATFADGATQQLPTGSGIPGASILGRNEHSGKVVRSFTVSTAAGRTITETNPLECAAETSFPLTVTQDRFSFRFDSCDTVTVTHPEGMRRIVVNGSRPGPTSAEALNVADGAVSSLSASLEAQGHIWMVTAEAGDAARTIALSPLAGCPSYFENRYFESTGPSTSYGHGHTCYQANLLFAEPYNGFRARSATVWFSDGTSVSETYDIPAADQVLIPAPPGTRPVRIVAELESVFEGEWFALDEPLDYEIFRTCESTSGETIRLADDAADAAGFAPVLDNDRPTPGAELRAETLRVVSAENAVAVVDGDGIRIDEVTGSGARIVYEVCDTFNQCATATLAVSLAAAPTPTITTPVEPADEDAGQSGVRVLSLTGVALLLVLVALLALVLRRRRVEPDTLAGDETQGE
jgi:hypothetical protein